MRIFKRRYKQLLYLSSIGLCLVGYVNCSSQGFDSLSSTQSSSESQTSDSSTTTSSTPTPTPPNANPTQPVPIAGPPATQPGVIPPAAPPASTPTLPPVTTGRIEVLLAAGKMGRTIMSCDDGVTWIKDRSDNDKARCWVDGDPNYVECDHDPLSMTGADVGSDGWFYAQYGWGFDGSIRRSKNGVNWETVRTGGWGGGLAAIGSSVISIWEGNWSLSKNNGGSWQSIQTNYSSYFDHAFIYRTGTKLFAMGRQNGELAVSLDSGVTWKSAPSYEGGWGNSGFAEGNGTIVSIGVRYTTGFPVQGFAARSTDNGATWKGVNLFKDQEWNSNIIFDGKFFNAWSNGRRYQSADGLTWASVAFTTGSMDSRNVSLAVSFNPRTGTYAGITSNWGNFYDKQRAFRSRDGITWTELDANHFRGGHPIARIVLGEMDRSACP